MSGLGFVQPSGKVLNYDCCQGKKKVNICLIYMCGYTIYKTNIIRYILNSKYLTSLWNYVYMHAFIILMATFSVLLSCSGKQSPFGDFSNCVKEGSVEPVVLYLPVLLPPL